MHVSTPRSVGDFATGQARRRRDQQRRNSEVSTADDRKWRALTICNVALPAFDVDLEGASGVPPELDHILFNGVNVGSLSGSNETWKLNEFQIPIELVRFGTRNVGGEPTPGNNQITILIDQGSGSDVNWCTAIDWVELTFKTVSPVILIHGNGQSGSFFVDTGFVGYLQSRFIPFDRSIALERKAIYANGDEINRQLPNIVKSFGVDSIHLVAHSKGGLDARAYLQVHQHSHDNDFKVLSLNTLSSPHDGTLLTDLLEERAAAAKMVGTLGSIDYEGFPAWTGSMAALATFDDGLKDLTTKKVAVFNASNVSALPPALSISTVGGDADVNENGRIDRNPDEYAGLRDFNLFLKGSDLVAPEFGRRIIDAMYQILRNTSSIKMECCRTTTTLFVRRKIATIRATPSEIIVPNDTLVTGASAIGAESILPRSENNLLYLSANGRNHANIADAGVAAQIVIWIFEVEQTRGDLR